MTSPEYLWSGGPALGSVDATGLRMEKNALWDLPHSEIAQDTPPDELHVIMLGVVQHLLAAIVFKISSFLLGFKNINRHGKAVNIFSKAYVQRLWSVTLKHRLEQNHVHQCGMQVNKAICDYMGKVAASLAGGERGKVTIEAGKLLVCSTNIV